MRTSQRRKNGSPKTSPHEAAGELQAALPHGEDVEERVDRLRVGDDVQEAGADHAGDDQPERHPVGLFPIDAGVGLDVAGGDPGTEHHAQRDHQAEGSDGERPDLEQDRKGGVRDRGQHGGRG